MSILDILIGDAVFFFTNQLITYPFLDSARQTCNKTRCGARANGRSFQLQLALTWLTFHKTLPFLCVQVVVIYAGGPFTLKHLLYFKTLKNLQRMPPERYDLPSDTLVRIAPPYMSLDYPST